ncbi:MAG: methionine synthase [Dehalococcoidia bacterium]
MDRKDFKPKGLPTAIGSMPHTDPVEACNITLENLPEIPVWPQLPNRTFLENMYVQYSEGFPGVVIEDERIYIDRSVDLSPGMEKLYSSYIANDIDGYAISPDYAAGFYEFVSRKFEGVVAVKGQVTGPISFGLVVTDQNRRPTLYDEILADAIARHLRMKAAWMERELAKLSAETIMFLDEPYLASLGSAFVALDSDTVIKLVNEALDGLGGLKGMHCCGNTDWSVLMATDIDILNFDAYNYGETLALFPAEVKAFLEGGGVLAWGIVPSEEEALPAETVQSLLKRMQDLMDSLVGKGIDRDMLLEKCLITPSCGTGSISPAMSARALELTAEISREFRSLHNFQ